MDPFILNSLKVISPPKKVLLRGKMFSPEVLMSPALCQPIVYFLASSLSERLHGAPLPGLSMTYSPEHKSGVSCAEIETKQTDVLESSGLAQKFLLVVEACDQILMPGRYIKSYDYSDLILDFREQLRIGYDKGDDLKVNDRRLHNVLYNSLDMPLITSGLAPSRTGVKPR